MRSTRTSKKTNSITFIGLLIACSSTQAVEFEVGDTTVQPYGYAKLDLIYDNDADLGNTIIRQQIALDGQRAQEGHTTVHAYQSRLGVITKTQVDGDELQIRVETDFYGNDGFGDGGGELRLRHAYATYRNVLAGQTWTNFGNVYSLYPTVDFNGSLAQGGGRQAQLRYFTDHYSISLEDSSGIAGGEVRSQDEENQFKYPDLTGRYQNQFHGVDYAVAGLLRYFKSSNESLEGNSETSPIGNSDSAAGYGLMVEARKSVSENLTVRGSISYGDGIGGYIYLNPAPPGYIDSDGDIETIKSVGGGASLSYSTGPGVATLGYGIVQADLDEAHQRGELPGNSSDEFQSVFLNYIWEPAEQITYGVEAGYHTRNVVDGRDGDAVRLQGMLKYSF